MPLHVHGKAVTSRCDLGPERKTGTPEGLAQVMFQWRPCLVPGGLPGVGAERQGETLGGDRGWGAAETGRREAGPRAERRSVSPDQDTRAEQRWGSLAPQAGLCGEGTRLQQAACDSSQVSLLPPPFLVLAALSHCLLPPSPLSHRSGNNTGRAPVGSDDKDSRTPPGLISRVYRPLPPQRRPHPLFLFHALP